MDGDDGAGILQRLQRTDHALGIIEALRRIAQTQRNALCTLSQTFLQQFPDELVLLVAELAVIETGGAAAESAHAHQDAVVDALRHPGQLFLIFR